ncbi:MAG: hypothetical protein NXI16_01400 [Alphaproteobacteria bacterium]|nr:hypothetical protein [Alphaproteobacteria bacterium]
MTEKEKQTCECIAATLGVFGAVVVIIGLLALAIRTGALLLDAGGFWALFAYLMVLGLGAVGSAFFISLKWGVRSD